MPTTVSATIPAVTRAASVSSSMSASSFSEHCYGTLFANLRQGPYTRRMGRPRLHDDAVRSRLLEAASTVLAQDGVAGLTVRDVAARAGTSTSAVYSLFGGRPE